MLNILEQKNAESVSKNSADKLFQCHKCSKIYKARNSLWYHERKCNLSKTENKDNIIHLLVTQNKELMSLLKNGITNHITTNNVTNNKTFNLHVFLNETCKDALNIDEFVSSIDVELEELENTGRRGYIEGISNIIIKRLNNLEQHFRPLHCSDSKREIFYIKENNEWSRENECRPILTKAIQKIANQNIKQIQHWRNKYPDCTKADSLKNDLYLKIVSNSMNGLTEEEGDRNIEKIISNIAKKVVIDKNEFII
jgi:uncharacterized C2H2 Zn-finger protein